MTTKILTGTYASGYALGTPITTLSIATSGYVEGTGVSTSSTATQSYTVINQGRILADDYNATKRIGYSGVYLGHGGSVTNGSASDTVAKMENWKGVYIEKAAGMVTNFATIVGHYGAGVDLGKGGVVINGSAADKKATIQAPKYKVNSNAFSEGVVAYGFATVQNFGTITGGLGIALHYGGVITNQVGATISGTEVTYSGATTVVNSGAIAGYLEFGLYASTGTVTNSGTITKSVLFEGSGAVTNSGTITYGVILSTGMVTNEAGATLGGVKDDNSIYGVATVDNAGSITGSVYLSTGYASTVTNGAGGAIGGSIFMRTGYGEEAGFATVTNAGFIGGDKGGGVLLFNGGLVKNLATGTITNAGIGAQDVAVKAEGHCTVINYGTISSADTAVLLDASSAVFLAEAGSVTQGTIAAGPGLIDFVSGAFTVGAIQSSGTVEGTGAITLDSGVSIFSAGIQLDVPQINVDGGATVDINTSLALAKVWNQSGGGIYVGSYGRITFSGPSDSFTGFLDGDGKAVFSGGADTFNDLDVSVATQIVNAKVTLSGTIAVLYALFATTPNLIVAASGANLTGGGELELSDTATNAITGATAAATLTNVSDRLVGAGLLGKGRMTLVNDHGAIINGNAALGLTINTGANTITNAGVIESTGAGGVTISSVIDNTGTMAVTEGVLAVSRAVSGAGTVRIVGGTADFGFSFAENVNFAGTTGELELARSRFYTGTITGFSTSGGTSLDLGDITFGDSTKATYSGTTSAGVLTVTDGTHTARINLKGNYTTSTFTTSSDGDGGTLVTDPAAPAHGGAYGTPQPHAFIEAMAGLGAGAGRIVSASAENWRPQESQLAKP